MKLKPCPFCDSKDVYVERDTYSDCFVKCNNCLAQGPTKCQSNDSENVPGARNASRAWNKRPAQTVKPGHTP